MGMTGAEIHALEMLWCFDPKRLAKADTLGCLHNLPLMDYIEKLETRISDLEAKVKMMEAK